jgi:hypothetical protein
MEKEKRSKGEGEGKVERLGVIFKFCFPAGWRGGRSFSNGLSYRKNKDCEIISEEKPSLEGVLKL